MSKLGAAVDVVVDVKLSDDGVGSCLWWRDCAHGDKRRKHVKDGVKQASRAKSRERDGLGTDGAV